MRKNRGQYEPSNTSFFCLYEGYRPKECYEANNNETLPLLLTENMSTGTNETLHVAWYLE